VGLTKPSGGVGVCNCCTQPPCDAPTLLCDSISASKSKCGFLEFVQATSPLHKYYRNWDRLLTETRTNSNSGPNCNCHYTFHRDARITEAKSYDSACVQHAPGQNGYQVDSYTISYSKPNPLSTCLECNESDTQTDTWVNGVFSRAPYSGDHTCSQWGFSSFNDCSASCGTFNNGTVTTSTTQTFNGDGSCGSGSVQHQEVITLSNEYTTAQLIANTIAALNDYSTSFGGAENRSAAGNCSAFRDLSTDEVSYSIRRTKYKVRHNPTGSTYLKVWLRQRFRPEGTFGSADVVTDLAAYIWNGTPSSGGLAFGDSTHRYNDIENRIDSAVLGEVIEPSSDGTLTVEINKWSCVEGYTPDDSINGFGGRPFPDNNPNAWPQSPVPLPMQHPHP
jgi:hypothetical protein